MNNLEADRMVEEEEENSMCKGPEARESIITIRK